MNDPGPIRPLARPGEQVLMWDRTGYNLYRVRLTEELPLSYPLIFNGGSVASAATLNAQNTQTQLDMPNGYFAQLRWQVWDDIICSLFQPSGLARFTNLNQNARVQLVTHQQDECDHTTEFCLYQNDRPFLSIYNPTGYTLAQSRVAFYGFKYALEGKDESIGGQITPIVRFESIDAAVKSGERFTTLLAGGWGN